MSFPGVSVVDSSPANAGDTDSVSESGRSPGEVLLLQYCYLGNAVDREAWRATVMGLKSQTGLSD